MPTDSHSIHPRVVNGRTQHDKVNTAKPYKGGGKLAKRQARLNVRRNDHAATLKSMRTATLGYKTPGSMKQGK